MRRFVHYVHKRAHISGEGGAIGRRSEGGDWDTQLVGRLGDELDELSFEEVGGAPRDLDGGIAAGTQRARRCEVDELVLAGAAAQH